MLLTITTNPLNSGFRQYAAAGYGRVRYAVQIEGLSRREAARQFGIDPRTVAKMLAFSVPPGYRRRRPPARPKLDPFTGIIDSILMQDEGRPRKQRHTSKRIFERLRDEHGYAGGITIVKDYVLACRLRQREVFVPLRHEPGHAQQAVNFAFGGPDLRTLFCCAHTSVYTLRVKVPGNSHPWYRRREQ